MIDRICVICGTLFTTDNSNKICCSRSCSAKFRWSKKEEREKMMKIFNDPTYRKLNSERQKKVQGTKEAREIKRKNANLYWSDSSNRVAYGKKIKEMYNDPGRRKQRSDSQKEINLRPSINEKIRERFKKYSNLPDVKSKKSRILKQLWKNPEYRKRFTDDINSRWNNDTWVCEHYKKLGSYKEFELPSGRIVRLQGYEPQVLEQLLQTYSEDDIVCEVKSINEEIGKILYSFEDKERRYYPDFYIKSTNTIIEVKSQWTFDKWKEKNLAKEQACLTKGFNFEFIIL